MGEFIHSNLEIAGLLKTHQQHGLIGFYELTVGNSVPFTQFQALQSFARVPGAPMVPERSPRSSRVFRGKDVHVGEKSEEDRN